MNNSINKGCCEKCIAQTGMYKGFYACKNPSCKCHSDKPVECEHEWCEGEVPLCRKCFIPKPPTKAPSWETEFDEKFYKELDHYDLEDFKSFIESLLTSERTRLLEGLGKMKFDFDPQAVIDKGKSTHEMAIYNQALSDTETLIKGELK